MNVLVVEDEKSVASLIRKGLEEQGFCVEMSHNGTDAHALATTRQYDVIVLDIMLPGRDGRIEGLDLGADDYLTKPFYVEELISRIHAVVRRTSGAQLSIFQAGDLSVNFVTREVRRGDRAIRLTAREFGLIEYLMRSPGRVFTRTQIIEHVWGYDFDPNTNLVDVYIKRLRKKICGDSDHDLIETVRGVGYRFVKP